MNIKLLYVLYFVLFIFVIFRVLSVYEEEIPTGKLRITYKITSEPLQYNEKQLVKVYGKNVYIPYSDVNYGDVIIFEGDYFNNKFNNINLLGIVKSRFFLDVIRDKILNFYNDNLNYPYSGLVSGMVLGSKSLISADYMNTLRKSGTAHVVVASGMNVVLIGGLIFNLLIIFTSKKNAILCSSVAIIIYAFLAQLAAPIVRAVIMNLIVYLSIIKGRQKTSVRILFITFVLMIIVTPHWFYDISFWLSFMATLSLMVFTEKINKRLIVLPSFIRESASTTIASQIGVLPILIFYFNNYNPVSVLINSLVLWVVPVITIIGGISGIIGMFIPFVGKLMLLLIYPLMFYFNFFVTLFK